MLWTLSTLRVCPPRRVPCHHPQALLHPDSPQAAAAALRRGDQPQPLPRPPEVTAGDLALLLLEEPLEGVPLVAVAAPQDLAAVGVQHEVWVVGWGATGDGDDPASYPRTLQEAALPLVSPDRQAPQRQQPEGCSSSALRPQGTASRGRPGYFACLPLLRCPAGVTACTASS